MAADKDKANMEAVLGCIWALRGALQLAGRNEGYLDSLDALEYEFWAEYDNDDDKEG